MKTFRNRQAGALAPEPHGRPHGQVVPGILQNVRVKATPCGASAAVPVRQSKRQGRFGPGQRDGRTAPPARLRLTVQVELATPVAGQMRATAASGGVRRTITGRSRSRARRERMTTGAFFSTGRGPGRRLTRTLRM